MLLKHIVVLGLALAATSPVAASAQSLSPVDAAKLFGESLRNASAVEFFFLSRTEEWSYSPSEVVKNSTVRAYRACGGNCENFMAPVLSHLRSAKPSRCFPGQQDAVIFGRGAWALLYSNQGHQIQIGSHCYWSETGIREVVAGDSMLFGG